MEKGRALDDPAPKWRKLRRRWEQVPSRDNWWAMYTAYLDSNDWVLKRKTVIKRDKRCRTCGDIERLEVHHLPCAYDDLGDEDPHDLITLCSRCHEAITSELRSRRYDATTYTPKDAQRPTPIDNRKIFDNVVQVPTLQDCRRVTPAAPQWATGRSAERVYPRVEAGEWQARKD